VAFAVEGPAEILGVENGDLNSAPTGDRTKRKANRGRGLAILQSTLNAGAITLKASAQGLDAVTVNLQSR
jgi:beta-galactosidase